QREIQRHAEIISSRQERAERKLKVAVAARGIPGDFQILICGVPPKKVGVAEPAPSPQPRIGGEIVPPDGASSPWRNRRHTINLSMAGQDLDAHELRRTESDWPPARVLRPAERKSRAPRRTAIQ